jgi:DNA polymerase-3 subunit epsilon
VGANLAYDLTLLEAENQRHSLPTLRERLHPKPIGPCVDVMVLDKHIDPYRKGGRKLTDLAKHYGVILGDAHTAHADALAACRLFPRILARSKELQSYPLGALHQAQIGWRKTQMDGLRAYFDKRGTEHDGCDGGWPLRTDRPELEEAS